MPRSIQKNRVENLNYARDRESKRLLWIHTQDRIVSKEIGNNMQYAVDSIMKEAKGWIATYAGKEGISMADALQLARTADIEALARKAKVYVKNKDFSDLANDEMRLYNFSMKMSRHDLLLRNMDLELIKTFSTNEKLIAGHLAGMSYAELERQAGILGLAVGNPAELRARAEAIANESFHLAHFSDRIWDNQKELQTLLANGVIKSNLMGQNPTKWMSEMRGNLTEAFNGSTYALKRLAVTESARVQIAAQKSAYEGAGYEWFEFIAEPTACEICRAFDGKFAHVKNMMIGGNAPPIHPFCKCSTAAYVPQDAETPIEDRTPQEPPMKFNSGEGANNYFMKDENYAKWKNSLSEKDHNSLSEYTSNVYKQVNSYNRQNFNWAPDGIYGSIIDEAENFMKNPPSVAPQGPDELFFDYKRRKNAIIPQDYSNAIASKARAIENTIQLDGIIERFELKNNIRTYRAIEPSALPSFNNLDELVGKPYKDSSFMSTSPSLYSKAVNKNYIMEITVPKGTGRGAYLEEFTFVNGEYEFVLPRNSEFKITGVRRDGEKNFVMMEMQP